MRYALCVIKHVEICNWLVYAIYKGKAKNPILEGLTLTCQQKGMAQGSKPRAQGKKKQKQPILSL